jgi:capsular polysaccharide biosynthesis protein
MPQPTILESLQRFWLVVVLFTAIGIGAGVVYGLQADPDYTAEAQLSVGRVDVATQSIPGFTSASITLADTYSRAIHADQVVADTAKATGLTDSEVIDQVTAAPIPETGTLRVFADSSSTSDAVEIANAAAKGLVEYVRKLNQFNPDAARLLNQYEEASVALGKARQKLHEDGSDPDAVAAVQRAQLQVTTIGNLYQSSQAGQSAPNTLQLLTLAVDADSDRSSTIQRAALVGGIIGLLLAVLLAPLAERRYPLNRPS